MEKKCKKCGIMVTLNDKDCCSQECYIKLKQEQLFKESLLEFGEACARIDKPIEQIAKERGLI
jgi:hypothetical protein